MHMFSVDLAVHLAVDLAALQGRFSPAWESIDIKRHIFLLLCNIHSVTAYEVSTCKIAAGLLQALGKLTKYGGLFMLQLPIYIPSEEERNDTLLYAKNVRQYMVRFVSFEILLGTGHGYLCWVADCNC